MGSYQSQVGIARRDREFSDEQMRRYFTEKRYSGKWIVGTILIGLVDFCSFAFNSYVGLLGAAVFVSLVSYIAIRARSIPTDTEYDEWLKRRARRMIPRAYKKLNLDRNDLIAAPLRIDSFVLPGSRLAQNFSADDVQMKEGKDGRWRFSVNVFMYLFPAEHFLAVFSGSVNALHQSARPVEETEEYFYDHIAGVTTFETTDYAVIYGYRYIYRIQKFSLRIVNGDDIDLGAYISASALDGNQQGPVIIPPTMNVDRVLAELRTILRSNRRRHI
ncbi:MAG TPA: hypothetical protein VF043_08350 [Ktedonobacteraceae bacterium]